MLVDDYYRGIVKHLVTINNLNLYDLQLDPIINILPCCIIYQGMCIDCGDCGFC